MTLRSSGGLDSDKSSTSRSCWERKYVSNIPYPNTQTVHRNGKILLRDLERKPDIREGIFLWSRNLASHHLHEDSMHTLSSSS